MFSKYYILFNIKIKRLYETSEKKIIQIIESLFLNFFIYIVITCKWLINIKINLFGRFPLVIYVYIKLKTSKNGNICFELASKLLIQSSCNYFKLKKISRSRF
jgi:hypothetical protein